ncbi:glycosyl transferase family 51 [Marinobacterium nitratireducens]|uniref:peptidoglycan glycosyltransferase n=1 Tax=Marinobacterium nitratireducens TaxID=518897 RepID=A0A917ZGQ2_9GAMM|nr:transglycosylase domain-containing protein [Marinobacterium nitratireducens]GGO82985.1 glycosyl transferase family 51 [Marinobacterium nitratireducens]
MPRKHRARRRLAAVLLFWVSPLLTIGALVGLLAAHEMRTAEFQARVLSRYATDLSYSVQPGPSDAILYPQFGPFDVRLGYARLPALLERAQQQNFEIREQSRFSEALMDYSQRGFYPPYPEKSHAGLTLFDCRGETLYSFSYPKHNYETFASIPPVIVQSLLFIENRELLDTDKPMSNPAVDWPRFVKAALTQVGKRLDIEGQSAGGSTLATQLEKYRHSPDGITYSAADKLKQMMSASVRAYQQGPETLEWRRRVVRDYLNSVPLSAAPGHGEVHGLAAGLFVWFNTDFDQVNRALADNSDAAALERGLALRQVLSLLISQRRPSYYLNAGREELHTLADSHIRLLADAGVIDARLRDAALQTRVRFRDWSREPIRHQVDTSKGINAARGRLSSLFGAPLYELDRFDLEAGSPLNGELQRQASEYLLKLADPEFAREAGLYGKYLLNPNDDTTSLRYSLTLFERSPQGNLVRVQTDSTNQPFDINEGSKLELGSTAKLRVLAHYLTVVAELHDRYSGMTATALREVEVMPNDYITHWAIDYLSRNADQNLPDMLEAALDRRYSASPWERFQTGGGLHTFQNFNRDDNRRRPTIREALRHSINLPFIRLFRDLVRYSTYQTPGNAAALLKNDDNPLREQYLRRFADREGRVFLMRFWRKYDGKSPAKQVETFLAGLRQTPVRLAAVHRYLMPEARRVNFDVFMKEQLPDEQFDEKELAKLYDDYGPGRWNLNDQGYIARVHPLELWLLRYRLEHPVASFADAVAASGEERQEVYRWLFNSRHKSARDNRIRVLLEVEAFLDIHERWQRLGYPFSFLVPSLATALGSSGDRPAALAELMGIILNDGVRLPTVRIQDMTFGSGTPYQTVLAQNPDSAVRVMPAEVAQALRGALSEVVSSGTARRLYGSFDSPDHPLVLGGKTGTGDNRIDRFDRFGHMVSSTAVNRTATFVFYLGPDHFGTLTTFVQGEAADDFSFTSSLPVQVLKGMAPLLKPYLEAGASTQCRAPEPALQQASAN